MLQVYIILLIFTLESVHSRKTCNETFCEKIRNEKSSEYYLNIEKLKKTESGFASILEDYSSILNVQLAQLHESTFRLLIEEATSSRFRPEKVLNGTADPSSTCQHLDQDNEKFTMQCEAVKLVIYSKPFKVEFYRDDDLIATINEERRLVFKKDKDTYVGLDVSFPGAKRAYGIPVHRDHLSLMNTKIEGRDPYRLYNVDYDPNIILPNEALHGSVPLLYAHSYSQTSGVFWLNSAETWVDINNTSDSSPDGIRANFMSEGGVIDMFIFLGPTLKDTVKQYAHITGTTPLPPYFALGYHYEIAFPSEHEILFFIDAFKKLNWPVDTLILNKVLDEKTVANLRIIKEALSRRGIEIVLSGEPTTRWLNGSDFSTTTYGATGILDDYGGTYSYSDFLKREVRDYFAHVYKLNETKDVYVWNKLGAEYEENRLPKTLVYYMYGGSNDKQVHNMYGLVQNRLLHEMMSEANPKRRPFILSKSHFAGIQRYAGVVLSRFSTTWKHLKFVIAMCLSEALSGLSFCGVDIKEPYGLDSEELIQRWFQVGAWLPIYASRFSQESFTMHIFESNEIKKLFEKTLKIRYAHLPMWYTLWWEHSIYGEPIIRPLTYQYPHDENLYDIDTEMLVGNNILVAPVLEPNVSDIMVYLPGGVFQFWYHLDEDFKMYRGTGETKLSVSRSSLPVFYRGGSIVCRSEHSAPSSAFGAQYPYTLYVFLDNEGEAKGTFYEDDFGSFDYKQFEYLYVEFTFKDNTLRARKLHEEASYTNGQRINTVVVVGLSENVTQVRTKWSSGLPELIYINGQLVIDDFELDPSIPFEISLH